MLSRQSIREFSPLGAATNSLAAPAPGEIAGPAAIPAAPIPRGPAELAPRRDDCLNEINHFLGRTAAAGRTPRVGGRAIHNTCAA